jgi:hypothetical protein
MIPAEKAPKFSPLAQAKVQRQTAAAHVEKARGRAAAKAAAWDVAEARVKDVKARRAAAVLAARPMAVLGIGDELRVAEAELEIAAAQAEASKRYYVAEVEALRAAESAVIAAAKAQRLAEMIDLAAKFNRAFDSAMEIGAQLQALALGDPLNRPLSGPGSAIPTLPKEVEQALERMPRLDPRHVPLRRLAQLSAADVA